MPSIKGQKVFIIGGSTGMGFAAADLCLQEDMDVHIASSNQERISNAVKRLESKHPNAKIKGHVGKLGPDDTENVLERLFAEVTADGPLDHVVYTAGNPKPRPITQINQAYLFDEARLTLITALLIGKVAPQHMKRGYTSSLTFTGGQIGEKPVPGYGVLCGFVGGLPPMVKGLAIDLKPLRCNHVSPGATNTELWGPDRHERAAAMAEKIPLGKVGTPEEVAEAYIYLMKDTNATGASISTNGGSVIQ